MPMNRLYEHFRDDKFWEVYEHGEWYETMRFLTTALLSASHAEADTFIIWGTGFEYYKDGVFVGKHLGGNAPVPYPLYSDLFRTVLKRDEIVREHATIVLDALDRMVVQLTYPD